jgi:hypothetical protein
MCYAPSPQEYRKIIQEVPDLSGKVILLLGLRTNSWRCTEGMEWHDVFHISALADEKASILRPEQQLHNFRQPNMHGPQNRFEPRGERKFPLHARNGTESNANTFTHLQIVKLKFCLWLINSASRYENVLVTGDTFLPFLTPALAYIHPNRHSSMFH